jgi:hypothetical protein
MELPSIHENHCLVQCQEVGCHSRHCCSHNDQELTSVTTGSDSNQHHAQAHSHHYSKVTCFKNAWKENRLPKPLQ